MVGVSLILFWPALFFVGGDKANAAEVARLKAEMQAIEQANVAKNCRIEFKRGNFGGWSTYCSRPTAGITIVNLELQKSRYDCRNLRHESACRGACC